MYICICVHIYIYIYICTFIKLALVAQMVKNLSAMWEAWVRSLGCDDPLEKEMATHSNIFPGECHGQRSLAGCSPWGHRELDTTEWLSTHACTFICWWPSSLIPCLGFVNSATMNTDLYVSFQIRVFVFPGYVCKSRIAHAFVLTLFHNSFPLQLQLLLESQNHILFLN